MYAFVFLHPQNAALWEKGEHFVRTREGRKERALISLFGHDLD